jgi:hypothetical protein
MNRISIDADGRFGQRFLGIAVAVPFAIVAGLITAVVMDEVLPTSLGKTLGQLTLFASVFIAAGTTGVAVMRAVGPKR